MKIFLVISTFFISYETFAQSLFKGIVKDERNNLLPAITISLLKKGDTATIAITQTDKRGVYMIKNIATGSYVIKATATGMKTDSAVSFEVTENKNTTMLIPDIIMNPKIKNLNEVSIIAPLTPVEVKEGKIVFNIGKSLTAQGTSAFEQLRRTPGVTADADDNLSLKGSNAVTVMIDGKMTYLGPQQLTTYLKSMPAENLTRIEVMTTPSSQYDASGNAGIINIVTKKMNRQGYALNIRAGTGAGKYLQSTDGFTGNIGTKQFNLFGGYNYNYNHVNFIRTSYRTISNNGKVVNYDRHSVEPSIAKNNSYKAGLDFHLSKKTIVEFIYSGTHNLWQRDGGGPTYLRNESGTIDSVIQNRNITTEPATSNTCNFNFTSRLDSIGSQLSFDADYARYHNNSSGSLGNGLYSPDNIPLQQYQSLAFEQPTLITIRAVKTDLVLPVKKSTWKAGAKYAYVTTDNDFRYDSLINGSYVYAQSLSNHFIYDEKVLAGYISLNTPLNKLVTIDAGVRVEHTNSKGNLVNTNTITNNEYTNLFPYLSVTKQMAKENSISISITRRINRPLYANLNPARFFFDKYSYYQGNPFLQPELAWNFGLSYSIQQKYSASFNYSHTNNAILQFATQDSATGVLNVMDRNFSHKNAADLLLVIPFKPFPFWSVQTILDIIYVDYFYSTGKEIFKANKLHVDVQLTQIFLLPKKISAELTAYYISPSLNGTYVLKTYFQADAGLKRSFLKNKLDVNLSLKDFLKTNRYWGYSVYSATNIRYDHRPDSRRINLALTWHIGGKLSTGKEHKLEEQERL